MKLAKLAEDYFKRASIRIKTAELAYSEGSYPDAAGYSQECVRLSLKAALRAMRIEYLKEYGVSSKIFYKDDSEKALSDAKYVFSIVGKLLSELQAI